MIRRSQKILIVRKKLSQFLSGCLIQDQTVDTLRPILISLVSPILTDTGATVRVDGATAFQAFERESEMPGTDLFKLNICNICSAIQDWWSWATRYWGYGTGRAGSDQWSKHFTARLRNRDPSEEERNKSNLPKMFQWAPRSLPRAEFLMRMWVSRLTSHLTSTRLD